MKKKQIKKRNFLLFWVIVGVDSLLVISNNYILQSIGILVFLGIVIGLPLSALWNKEQWITNITDFILMVTIVATAIGVLQQEELWRIVVGFLLVLFSGVVSSIILDRQRRRNAVKVIRRK